MSEPTAADSPGDSPVGDAPTVASIADAIADRGWCVAPRFLRLEDASELAAEARQLWAEGAFRRAGVGRGAELEVRPEVRRDWVLWLDATTSSPAIGRYFGLVEALRRAVNERLYLGLFDFEAHLTVYPPDAFYRRHLDRFRGVPWRTVSLLLYLNEGWQPEDGGQLRLELGPDASATAPSTDAVEILPTAGTLVAFLSDRFWHEVLPARRERMSLTGWLKLRS